MELYKYNSYQEYVDAQVEANVRKIKCIWVSQDTIKSIYKHKPNANFIICHGTRNAKEQQYFIKYYPNADVIGTEISHTADQFPMTVQHDFHIQRDDWVGQADIVYSNAFDHSYDPQQAFKTWSTQVKPDGVLCVELMTGNDNRSKITDPLKIELNEFLELAISFGWSKKSIIDTSGVMSRNKSILCILEKLTKNED
jgi:trans-aconitate methyltransferase